MVEGVSLCGYRDGVRRRWEGWSCGVRREVAEDRSWKARPVLTRSQFGKLRPSICLLQVNIHSCKNSNWPLKTRKRTFPGLKH